MVLLALSFLLAASPQDVEAPVPAACIGATFVSWEACAAAAPDGSPAQGLAMINLGTEAYVRGDLAAALAYYDKAERPGQRLSADILFHTFRGDARRHGGRLEEAREDAAVAWNYLNGQVPDGVSERDILPLDDEVRHLVLTLILPILKDGDRGDFQRAREVYLGLPAKDWQALSHRAATLSTLGEHEAAIAASKAALDLQPADSMTRNNHCYILVEAGRAGEGLPYCESAVAALPEAAPVRHSYAAALAATGRCGDAETQLAEARRLDPSAALYQEAISCTPGVEIGEPRR